MLSKMYKLIFDLSICFLIGGFVLAYLLNININIGDFLILAFTALIMLLIGKKKKIKFVLLVVIPLLYLVFASLPLPELIMFCIIWAYFAYEIIFNRYEISRGELIDMLKRILIFSIILFLLMLFHFSKLSNAFEVIINYSIFVMISAIFLLRNLRVGNDMEQMKTYEKQQFIELTLFLIICLLLTLLKAPLHVLEGVRILYFNVVAPVVIFLFTILGIVVLAIFYLLILLLDLITGGKKSHIAKSQLGELIGKTTDSLTIVEKNNFSIVPILYFLGVAGAIVSLFFFFRWLRGRIYIQNIPSGIEEIRENLNEVGNKRKISRRKPPKDARESIRYYYGKYMLWLQSKQVELGTEDTTSEIHNKYRKSLEGDKENKSKVSKEFSKLYQASRYQMSKEITQEEAARSKELYQSIKNTKLKRIKK